MAIYHHKALCASALKRNFDNTFVKISPNAVSLQFLLPCFAEGLVLRGDVISQVEILRVTARIIFKRVSPPRSTIRNSIRDTLFFPDFQQSQLVEIITYFTLPLAKITT